MRHLAFIVLAVLWANSAQAETKAVPDGFGPIKFGMTKEEAWAATGGTGEWKEEDQLSYSLNPWNPALEQPEITVSQWFDEGKASFAIARLLNVSDDYTLCQTTLRSVVSHLAYRYGTPPVRTETRPSGPWRKSWHSYSFVYEDQSFIDVEFEQYYPDDDEKLNCSLSLVYSPVGVFKEDTPF